MALIKKRRKAKKDVPFGEKPPVVKTHLRNMVIVPEMIGSMVGVYNGKQFNAVEIKVYDTIVTIRFRLHIYCVYIAERDVFSVMCDMTDML